MRTSVASLSKKIVSMFFAVTLALGLIPAAAVADSGALDDADTTGALSAGSTIEGIDPGIDDVAGSTPVVDLSASEEGPVEDDATTGDDENLGMAILAGDIINQEMPLSMVAQAESTRSYFLAQTLESTKTVPVVSAKLPLDSGVDQGSQAGADDSPIVVDSEDEVTDGDLVVVGTEAEAEDELEGGGDSDRSDQEGVSSDSMVVGSFIHQGVVYAVEPGGDSVAIVAADYGELPEESIVAQSIVVPSAVSANDIDRYMVSRIADGAFSGVVPHNEDEGITAITIPASITEMGDDAFSGFDTLQYVIVSEGNPVYGMYDGCLYEADLTSLLLIPEGRVGAVRIAPSATDIDPEVFSHCPSVDEIIADEDSAAFSSADGCLYSKDSTALLRVPRDLSAISIVESCVSIGSGAFENCDKIASIDVLGNTADFDASAFSSSDVGQKSLSFDPVEVEVYLAHYENRLAWERCGFAIFSEDSNRRDATVMSETAEKTLYSAASGSLTYYSNIPCVLSVGYYEGTALVSAYDIATPRTVPGVNWFTTHLVSVSNYFADTNNRDDVGVHVPNGYKHLGFFLDPAYTQELVVGVGYSITQYNAVYIKFVPLEYLISYDLQGGQISGQRTSYTIEAADFSLPVPSRLGYTFAGWAVAGAFGAGLTGNGTTNVTVKKGTYGSLAATAKWTPNTYAVSFSANGGSGGQSANVTATYDAAMPAISAAQPVRVGYTFEGWYDTDAPSGGTQYYTAEGASARAWDKTAATTLFARWTADSHTARLHANDGADTMVEHGVTYDAAVAAVPVPKRYGYVFAGYWTKSADGSKGEPYFDEGGSYVRDSGIWKGLSDVDLYACWKLMANLEVPINAPGAVTLGVDRATAIEADASGTPAGPEAAGALRSSVPQEVPIASIELEPLQDADGTASVSRVLGEGNPERCAVEVSLGSSSSALLRLADATGAPLRWEPPSPLAIPAAVPVASGTTGEDVTSDSSGNLARLGELSLTYAMRLFPGFDVYRMPAEDATSEPVARIVFTVDLTGLVHEEF